MSALVKSVSAAILVALTAACAPPPPQAYEATVALPKPPSAASVAHLKPSELCAALAGDPLEAGAMGRGAYLDQIDFGASLPACDAVIASGKANPIDYYNRARSLHAGMLKAPAGESAQWAEDAYTAYEVAADKGHPYAMMVLAELRLDDLLGRPRDVALSGKLRAAALEKLDNPSSWWPETRLYLGMVLLRDDNFELRSVSESDEARRAKTLISGAAHGGLVRLVGREYDMLGCSDFDGPAPGNPRGEACEMLLTTMAENGMVGPAAALAVREYNAGARVAQRYGVRHNDARNGYSRGKFWAEMALDGTVDKDEGALQLAREIRDNALAVENAIARQDKTTAAIIDFFGKAFSGSSGRVSSSGGYEMDLSYITDPHKNGTCLGAGLVGDGLELFASGC